MTPPGSSPAKVSFWGLGARLLVLVLALAVVAVPLGAWRAQSHAEGWWSALVAFAVVGAGFTASLVITSLARATPYFIHAQLGTMIFRVGLPLGVGMFLQSEKGGLAQAGVLPNMMFLYLVGLVVETLLVLRLAKRGGPASKSSLPGESGSAESSSADHRSSGSSERNVTHESNARIAADKEPASHG